MPDRLTFRRALPADIPLLRDLAERIWRVSYAAMLSTAQIDHMLAWMYGGETIASEMAEGIVWELAEVDGGAAGYTATAFGDDGIAWLNKLYLLPERQGRGEGQAMLARAEALAWGRRCDTLRLRVNKTNARALRAYERSGFAVIDAVAADIGGGFVMDDFILSKPLVPVPPKVKICGLSTAATLEATLEAGAEFVGLNFFPKSPRHVSVESARALAERARGRAEIVALMVDADDDELDRIVAGVQPDWLQVHGRETQERVAAIRRRFGLRVMRAIGVSTAADVVAADAYTAADMILFDAKPPRQATLPGGNGVAFDWALLAGVVQPYMLSGGLTPDTVAEAIRTVRPAAVDVSSGVESGPGVKDATKIHGFIKAVRGALSG